MSSNAPGGLPSHQNLLARDLSAEEADLQRSSIQKFRRGAIVTIVKNVTPIITRQTDRIISLLTFAFA
ncbi:hypothetical protein ABIB66_006080 [Bradyrhizobium sp. F1.13.3]